MSLKRAPHLRYPGKSSSIVLERLLLRSATATGATAHATYGTSTSIPPVAHTPDASSGFVLAFGGDTDGALTTKITIGGVSARIVAQVAQDNALVGIAVAEWPGSKFLSVLSVIDIPVNIVFAATASNFNTFMWHVKGLASSVPLDAQTSATATDTARSVDLKTSPGGIIIAASMNNITAAQSCTWTGDQAPTERVDTAVVNGAFSAAEITNTNDDIANTITATWAVISTAGVSIAAASFR